MPQKLIDISGQKFSRITVICRSHYEGKSLLWKCVCDCGNEVLLFSGNLRAGTTKSCGCLNSEKRLARNTTHGLKGHPLYIVWCGMVQRCEDQNADNYHNYGGRGIQVCERWRSDFKNFYDDLIVGYQKGLSLDRIDNNSGYSPSNCRWATSSEQRRNVRPRSEWKMNGKASSDERGVPS